MNEEDNIIEDRGDDFVPTGPDAAAVATVATPTPTVEKTDKATKAPEAKEEEEEEEELDADDKDKGDPENEADPEAEAEKKAKGKKDTRIPLSRHQEILDKNRAQYNALKQENELLKLQKNAEKTAEDLSAAEVKIEELETSYADLLSQGETEKATKVMAEIRRLERSVSEAKYEARAQAAERNTYERIQYDATVSSLESAYPAINEDSDEFDQEKTNEVIGLFQMFVTNGQTRSAAVQRAVRYVLGDPKSAKQEEAMKTQEDKVDVATKRKTDAVDRNISAHKRQPANLANKGAGGESTTAYVPDVLKMSQDAFDKLSEDVIKANRGDEL